MTFEISIREHPEDCRARQNGYKYSWEVVSDYGGCHSRIGQAEDLDDAISGVRKELKKRGSPEYRHSDKTPEPSRDNVELVEVPDEVSKTELLGTRKLTEFTGGEPV